MINTFIVEDVMVIAGGRPTVKYRIESTNEYSKTLDVIHSDGRVCGIHDLPDLPKTLEGFGMASKKDRYIYVCGGQERDNYCFTTCGMYYFRLIWYFQYYLRISIFHTTFSTI